MEHSGKKTGGGLESHCMTEKCTEVEVSMLSIVMFSWAQSDDVGAFIYPNGYSVYN